MLRLNQKTIAEIQSHGVASYPYEGCGLLLGRAEDGLNIVAAIFPVPNRWEVEEEKRVRFLISDGDISPAISACVAWPSSCANVSTSSVLPT